MSIFNWYHSVGVNFSWRMNQHHNYKSISSWIWNSLHSVDLNHPYWCPSSMNTSFLWFSGRTGWICFIITDTMDVSIVTELHHIWLNKRNGRKYIETLSQYTSPEYCILYKLCINWIMSSVKLKKPRSRCYPYYCKIVVVFLLPVWILIIHPVKYEVKSLSNYWWVISSHIPY